LRSIVIASVDAARFQVPSTSALKEFLGPEFGFMLNSNKYAENNECIFDE
jgi:hypothetical protein